MKLKKIFSFGILALCISLANPLVAKASTQQLEVHHINVGQGEAIYIEFPDGTDVLIDSGKTNQGSTVVNYLKNQEKNIDIEYLIATHPDADHIGGMQSVFKDLNVKNFLYPQDAPYDTATWKNVLDLAKKEVCSIKDTTPGTEFNISGATVRFIQPNKDYSDNNDDSVVTYLDYNNAEFLFTGDIESTTEKDMLNAGVVPNVDFMSVPHHGSKTSSTSSFITTADPEYATVSVGQNSYGHPVQEILNRYSNIGAKIYRTDINGSIVIKTDGNSATINGQSVSIIDTVVNQEKLGYLINSVYKKALNREADGGGYNYWFDCLSNRKIGGRYFLTNLLYEPEFMNKNMSDDEFIISMYDIIADRKPDNGGFNYWKNRYNENLRKMSVKDARLEIVNRMMNEAEFKTICGSMDILY